MLSFMAILVFGVTLKNFFLKKAPSRWKHKEVVRLHIWKICTDCRKWMA